MSEPKTKASKVETVLPGLFHWTVNDDRIDFRGDGWALQSGDQLVFVDPEPLQAPALEKLGRPTDIVLTIQSHQRAAWRYRKRFGARVHAPEGAEGLEEEPDQWYGEGASLPGGLQALHAPGPCQASYALLLDRPEGRVAFTGDLVTEDGDGGLTFVADAYQDAPRSTRESVRRLADEQVAIVCPGHGAPIRAHGAERLGDLLERDASGA
jgi:glyoxylase-like metal-dependent hydrolase (beta-lactamase superfamily II)